MSTFVTSDTHLDHKRLIELGYRKFRDNDEMTETIISNWNVAVKETDTIYVLGDFAFANRRRCEYLLSRLNGHKILIRGNHDSRQVTGAKGWMDVRNYKRIRFHNYRFIASHYPILSWHGMNKGTIMIHGHCHGNLNKDLVKMIGHPLVDMGCDLWNYTPVNLWEIIDYVNGKDYSYTPIDHH